MTTVKKLVNSSGGFEDAAKFNWEPLESFENRRCLCIFVTVCDNPGKGVLNTLQFAHVEAGQTSVDRVAIIKTTTHQGISRQDSSIIGQLFFFYFLLVIQWYVTQ